MPYKKNDAAEIAAKAIQTFGKKGGQRCLTCDVVKADSHLGSVILQIRAQKGSLAVVSSYLNSLGHKISTGALRNHFGHAA